jgi:cytochrome P450
LIRRGDIVAVSLASASRDIPLPDNAEPNTLNVARTGARHLGFGHGIHYCLGAPLGRMEANIALGALLARFPDLRLAIPVEQVPWIGAGMMRGPLSLPVRFTPAS